MFCDIEGWMRMGYFLHLRAAIHQGTDTRLLKKKLTMCVCVFVLLYCLNASKCVCTSKHYIMLFQLSTRFPCSLEKVVFQETQSGNIPVAWGKSITLACSLYRNEFGSHTTEGVSFPSLSLSTLQPTPLWWPQVNLRCIGLLVPENVHLRNRRREVLCLTYETLFNTGVTL